MLLFRQDKDAFEREHAIKWPQRKAKTANDTDGGQKKTKKKKKKKRR